MFNKVARVYFGIVYTVIAGWLALSVAHNTSGGLLVFGLGGLIFGTIGYLYWKILSIFLPVEKS